MDETLLALLDDVASGRYPPPDGAVTVLPQASAGRPGVFGFTAHTVIFANVDPGWVRDQLPDGDLAAIAPANAVSVRAFLSADFIPVAAEALLVAP